MSADTITWVVPCFNEAGRIDQAAFLALADQPGSSLLLIDDGSRDTTLLRLRDIANQRPERISVLALPHNQGKAEAVRQGILRALAGSADLIGFADADMATPPPELQRLAELVRTGEHDLVLGSRVQLLGRTIRRRHLRHYLGRVFATCASLALGLAVYDTQCGAKVFRRSQALREAVGRPFRSRWAFDVELLGRLVHPERRDEDRTQCDDRAQYDDRANGIPIERIWEEPLRAWTDVTGSKLGVLAGLRGAFDVARIGWAMRRERTRKS